MSDADRAYLKTILAAHRSQQYPDLSESDHFEVFTAEQIMKNYAMDTDDIESGHVGATQDGGVDSIYFLIDRRLVKEDVETEAFKGRKGIPLELILIQSTRSRGFSEDAIRKLREMTDNLLDVGRDISEATGPYNAKLVEIVERFRTAFTGLLLQSPHLSISYYYATQADDPHPTVKKKADALVIRLKELYTGATCKFEFITAKELLIRKQRTLPTNLGLRTYRSFSSSQFGNAYVCLVPLGEFFGFITTDGDLRHDLFESNVRDYQGEVAINHEIQTTLESGTSGEFWWLNNGITVLASKATMSGDILAVEDPEIVNGLQTSFKIYQYYKDHKPVEDKRNVLVRVIEVKDAKSREHRDRIIKATNSQTRIPPSSLHATDEIHRQIEDFLKADAGLYYERRKSYYKNRGVPVAKIITIPYLTQALLAIYLQKPDDARARPTTAQEREYPKLYGQDYPPKLYSKCALLMKRVDAYLAGLGKEKMDVGTKSNIRFYLAMYASCVVLKSPKPEKMAIANLDLKDMTDSLLAECCTAVAKAYRDAGGNDQVAKGTVLLDMLRKELTNRYRIEIATPE